MDDIIDDLTRIAQRCRRASKALDEELAANGALRRVLDVANSFADAWSNSWIGYQSRVYKANLEPAKPGEHFNIHDGSAHGGPWAEFSYDGIRAQIFKQAAIVDADVDRLCAVANEVESITTDCIAELLPTLDAVISVRDDVILRENRDKIAKISTRLTPQEYIAYLIPKGGSIISSDMRAMQGGLQSPPHLGVFSHFMAIKSTVTQAATIEKQVSYITRYLQKAMKMKGKSAAKTDGPIFIGHGRAGDWRDLKDFLHEKLKLDWEEFNRKSVAGKSNKERLLEMLDRCPFAFLVMTAEDETASGKFQARANVIHEAGLFQGLYGFERAIILLEEGCEEFSNVQGIGQIRFKKGSIAAKSEEVRDVLQREGMIH